MRTIKMEIRTEKQLGSILSTLGKVTMKKIGGTNIFSLVSKFDEDIDDNLVNECESDIKSIDSEARILTKII